MNNIDSNFELVSQNIKILFEHSDFIAVNKPKETSFHNENSVLGFFNLVKMQCRIPLWPVHRLDKLTSGIIIFAKSANTAKQFGLMFESKRIEKVYLAISDKKPKKKQGKIIGDMKKSRNGSWMLTQSKVNPAITRFQSIALKPKIRLFMIMPLTGKTHQIRVALKSLGSPILGDSRYGGSGSDRAYLHAYRIRFNWNNEAIEIEDKPTQGAYFQLAEMQSALIKLRPDTDPFT